MREISDAFRENDLETARKLVHTLKGVAGNISAKELHASARDLEQAVKSGESKRFEVILEKLQSDLDCVLLSIQNLENKPDPNNGGPPGDSSTKTDSPEIEPILRKLAVLLRENDLEAEEYMDAVKEHILHAGSPEQTRLLQDQIGALDFKNAEETLIHMADGMGIALGGAAS